MRTLLRLGIPLLAASALLFGVACKRDAPAPVAADAIFLRGAILLPGAPGGAASSAVTDRVVGPDAKGPRHLLTRAWTPGEAISLGGATLTAPILPECVSLFQVPLGDLSTFIAAGGTAPDTALAFSPDGETLAIGSYLGEVIVVDAFTGDIRARRRFPEAVVKHLAFAPGGATLYAAEQSPDALVHALDPETLKSRWTYRLADEVETSPPPPGEDLYGIYTLPTAYGLSALPGGDLIVAAAHGWSPRGGERRNLARILRLTPAGEVAAAFPAEGPADAIFMHPRVDGEGGLVAFTVHRSAAGPVPPGNALPIGGAQVLSLPDLTPAFAHIAAPLAPHFKAANLWEAIDVSKADGGLFLGYGDGRARVIGMGGALRFERDTGAPVMAGDVPIAAGVSFGGYLDHTLYYLTTETVIPFGATRPELRPPSLHPNENTLYALSPTGEERWRWSGDAVLTGFTPGPQGQRFAIGAGARQVDTRRDLYGALLFEAGSDAAPGARPEPLLCPTEGPVFFHQALSADGRVAVAEYPYVGEGERQVGAYRVTVLR